MCAHHQDDRGDEGERTGGHMGRVDDDMAAGEDNRRSEGNLTSTSANARSAGRTR